MNTTARCFLITLCFSLSTIDFQATHLIGGSLSYEYLGQNVNGTYRYRIFAITYTDCGPTSNFPDPEGSIPIAIYTNNLNAPNAPKFLADEIVLSLISFQEVQPDLPSSCTVAADVCVEEGFYEAFVDVPLNFGGYWLYYDRCCRNDAVVNLQALQGVGFTTYIPSPLVVNSSPFFNAPPTPYICAGDTATFLNTAVDPDGDLLVFSFINPFRGNSSDTNPNPGVFGYPDPITWPIPNATYNATYNQNSPFGAGGYAFINGATGLTEYSSPNSGQFAVAVEIKEYRNGNLIGITRRDLQLLVINCPPNPAPNLSAVGGGQTDFTVAEGEQLCFPVNFIDQNGDSLFLSSNGEVFDTDILDPVATITTPQEGLASVQADFCWETTCDQGRQNPYFFSATATDNGCPPKSASIVYTIQVVPFIGSSFINGNGNACEFSTETYTTDEFTGGDYVWTTAGGSIISGQGTNEIEVEWGASGAGQVSVTATNGIGCVGDPFDLDLAILPLPNIDAGLDVVICLGDTISLGGNPTGPTGSFYSWTPLGEIENGSVANPNVFPSASGMYFVTVVGPANCSATDSVMVTVNETPYTISEDVDLCFGTSTVLVATGGVTYSWTPGDSLDDPSSDSPIANPSESTVYEVTLTDSNNCQVTDSVIVSVFEVPVAEAGQDTILCGSALNLFAEASVGIGTWSFPAELTLSDLNNPNSLVSTALEGTYTLIWTEVNGGICSDQDNVDITFIDQPMADAGEAQNLCGLSGLLSAIPSLGTGIWTIPTGLTLSGLNDPEAEITADAYGSYTLTWSEENNGCTSEATVDISFTEQPAAEAGEDDGVCGDSYTLSATPSVGTGTWSGPVNVSFSDVNNPAATVTLTGAFGAQQLTWTEDNGNGCADSETITITFNPFPVVDAGEDQSICALETILEASTDIGTGTWSGPADVTFTDVSSGNSGLTGNTPGAYILTWSAELNGCTSTQQVLIEFLEVPVADAGEDEELCLFSSLFLDASGGDQYEWSPSESLDASDVSNPSASPEQTTTYTVLVTLDNGCTDSDEVIITVNALPFIDAGEDVGYLCTGDAIQLQATSGLSTYSWSPSSGLSATDIENPLASPDTAAVIPYTVTVTDVNGCENSDVVVVTVNPIVPTAAGNDTLVCTGEPVILGGSPTSPAGSSFIWSPVEGLNDTLAANPIATPSVTTTYTVISSNSICEGQSTVTVNVENVPELTFDIQASASCEELKINFLNSSDFDLSYAWDFGDGNGSAEYSPSHSYGFNGQYLVLLTATSDLGCTYTTDTLINADDFATYFPVDLINVITPNGDGENDVLDVGLRGAISECLNMEVFNRWGQIVFKSFGNNTQWDGRTPAGELVSPGVYFYFIELKGSEYKGSVHVIY